MNNLTTISRIIIVVFLLITTLTFAQKLEKIRGSKIVTLSEITLDSIGTIELYKNIDLTLKQSDNVRLAIYADDNLHDIVDLDIDEGKLSISLLRRITSKKKFELTLYINDLSRIVLNDDSTLINNDFFETDDISIVLNNKSDFKCLFDADMITFEGNDTSKAETNFRAKSVNYRLKDRAKIKGISNSEITKIKAVSKNLITLSGKSEETFINAAENSTFKLSNLINNVTEVRAEDKSSIYVYSKEDMSIYAKDDSRIYVYGNCNLDLIEFNGTASLYKKE